MAPAESAEPMGMVTFNDGVAEAHVVPLFENEKALEVSVSGKSGLLVMLLLKASTRRTDNAPVHAPAVTSGGKPCTIKAENGPGEMFKVTVTI